MERKGAVELTLREQQDAGKGSRTSKRTRIRCHVCGSSHWTDSDREGDRSHAVGEENFCSPAPGPGEDDDRERHWEGETRFLEMTAPGFAGLTEEESRYIRARFQNKGLRDQRGGLSYLQILKGLGIRWSEWALVKCKRILASAERKLREHLTH